MPSIGVSAEGAMGPVSLRQPNRGADRLQIVVDVGLQNRTRIVLDYAGPQRPRTACGSPATDIGLVETLDAVDDLRERQREAAVGQGNETEVTEPLSSAGSGWS